MKGLDNYFSLSVFFKSEPICCAFCAFSNKKPSTSGIADAIKDSQDDSMPSKSAQQELCEVLCSNV